MFFNKKTRKDIHVTNDAPQLQLETPTPAPAPTKRTAHNLTLQERVTVALFLMEVLVTPEGKEVPNPFLPGFSLPKDAICRYTGGLNDKLMAERVTAAGLLCTPSNVLSVRSEFFGGVLPPRKPKAEPAAESDLQARVEELERRLGLVCKALGFEG